MPYLTQSQKKNFEVGPPLTFHTWLNQKSQICHVGYQKSHNYQPKAIGEGIRAVGAVVQFLEV